MSDLKNTPINHVTKSQEATSDVKSISYNVPGRDGNVVKKNKSIMMDRLYIPGYRAKKDPLTGENSYAGVENELWAAKVASSKGNSEVDPDRKNIDHDLANEILASDLLKVVQFDDFANRFYVLPEADLTTIQEFGIALNSGDTLAKNELASLERAQEQNRVSDVALKTSRRKDYSSELAEGATKIELGKPGGDTFTLHYVKNRNYLTVSGERTHEQKDKTVDSLVKNFDKVKRDSFAGKQPYIDFSATKEEREEILSFVPDVFTTRGHKSADFSIKHAKASNNFTSVNSEDISGAQYTEMRQGFVDAYKKAEAEKAAEKQAGQPSVEDKAALDSSHDGPVMPSEPVKEATENKTTIKR